MADDWPLRSYLKLGALPGAVSCARLHARQVLWEWGFSDIADTAELLVSELTTNAMYASQAVRWDMPIRFWLLSDKTRVVILVWDGNHHPPVPREVDEDAESGRGLKLVDTLSDKWGWYTHQELGGKIVWCELSLVKPNDSSHQFPEHEQ
jgi:anti-sigma regulatory factor (Ser/Thr protein kinase)